MSDSTTDCSVAETGEADEKMARRTVSQKNGKEASAATVDLNANVMSMMNTDEKAPEDVEKVIVDTEDTWIGKLMYGGPVNLTHNFCILVAITIYFSLTIKGKLEDEEYSRVIYRGIWLPTVTQLLTLTIPMNIVQLLLILFVVYPASRVHRSKVFYYLIGAVYAAITAAIICYRRDEMTVMTRTINVLDWGRLFTKVISFLVECLWSDRVFEKTSIKSLFYFALIPHLIYEPSYPKARRIRWAKVLSHTWWLLLAILIGMPAFFSFFTKFQLDIYTTSFLDGLLPALYFTLATLLFYPICAWFFMFEIFFGLHGELLRFPYLKFFGDWHQFRGRDAATELNIKVSNWLSRYFFVPSIKSGASRFRVQIKTWTVTTILHEIGSLYLMGIVVPLRIMIGILAIPYFMVRPPKNQVLTNFIAGLIYTSFMLSLPVEYMAWNFSTMPCVDQLASIQIVPLAFLQMYYGITGSTLQAECRSQAIFMVFSSKQAPEVASG